MRCSFWCRILIYLINIFFIKTANLCGTCLRCCPLEPMPLLQDVVLHCLASAKDPSPSCQLPSLPSQISLTWLWKKWYHTNPSVWRMPWNWLIFQPSTSTTKTCRGRFFDACLARGNVSEKWLRWKGDHGPYLMTTTVERMTATMTITSSDGRNDDNNK